jgi:tellurite methyltransferase
MEPLGPQQARQRAAQDAVLDVREGDVFSRGHLAGSGHLPFAELRERRAELPPRGAGILVVAERAARAAEAAAALEAMGYAGVGFLDAPLAELPGGLDDRGPAARLWRPARFLEEVLPVVLEALPVAGPHTALDVASGAGRDAVFLAGHGFEVEARDRAPEALERARDLARRAGVALRTVVCDLEWAGLPPPGRTFDLVVCFRFLHRPLFPWMQAAVAPGGWLVYETYRAGQERHGRPRRAHFMLQPGELARAFPALETVRHEELDPPGGPVTARLLARRPPAGGPGRPSGPPSQ